MKTIKNKEVPVRLQLVLSGVPGYFKLRSKHDDLFKITAISLRCGLDYIESKLPGNVDIHGLYNAYTEENMARRAADDSINEPFTKIFPNGLHADSGGLQMVTLGKGTITASDRLKIYKTQATYSHYAMSFDEIPSLIQDDVRYYLPHIVMEKGIQSGANLKEQYDYFETIDTNCKIIPIAQGWGIDDTNTFAKGLFGQLTKEQYDKVDVVATGFPTTAIYATAKRVYDMFKATEIPVKAKKHVHLLGVTGFKRLIPALIMIKNGFTPQLEILSFDSVTITMSYVMGNQVPTVENFLTGQTKIKLGKKRNSTVEKYWQDIYDFWKDDPNFIFDDLDDLIDHSYYNKKGLNSGFQQYEHYLQADENGNFTDENKIIADLHFTKVLKQEQYYILYQVHNYVQILESFLEDKIKLEHIFDGKNLEIFSALEKVKTDEEFTDWFSYVQKVTGFKVPVLDGNHLNNIDIVQTLFGVDMVTEERERKKQPARITKPVKTQDDTTTTNLLF
jgi:hypothetical protein